jgi:CBS-domain-containing membrane protein
MQIIDEKFKDNKMKYVAQSVLAMLAMTVVLMFLDVRDNAATVAALGSSSFIVFTMPGTQSSRPRFLIGGYIVAIATGSLCNYLTTVDLIRNRFESPDIVFPLFAALSVGLAIFLMVILNFEHPPAGGVALGLVINDYSFIAVVVVLIGVLCLSLIRKVFSQMMINLL